MQIVATQTYKNFEMQFHDPNWVDYINNYVAGGGLASDLIECVEEADFDVMLTCVVIGCL